ncbi:MAG: hypothetical protein ABI488_21365 [Polyangiaceae bacterium]
MLPSRTSTTYDEPVLMAAVAACSVAVTILMLVDIPRLAGLIASTAPAASAVMR